MNNVCLKIYLALSFVLAAFSISCKSNAKTQNISEENSATVLVDLTEKGTADVLILDFSEINLQKIKKISRPLNIILFSFDSTKIDMDTLVSQLKQSSIVEDAQSNKNSTNRN